VTVTTIGARAAFLGATSVLALIVTTPAQARCVSAGTTATCDAAAPNPEINGVIGTQVTVQSGAIVRLDDPFAGASVRYETATINNGGTLTTAAGSQILDANTTTAVASGGGVTINHSGTITARRANARGVALGQGDTLTVNAGGVIETLGAGSSLVFQNSSAAVAIGGSGSSVTINGIVRSAGDFAPAITTSTSGFFGPTLSPAAITIGATGAVSTAGANSTAIAIGGGSTLSIAGTVTAGGTGSSAVTYQAGSGDVAITVLSGGSVSAASAAAITGSGANVVLRVSGTVSSGNAAAIALGSGADRITLDTGARITGLIDGGTGIDSLTLNGSGAGTLGSTANIETLSVASGRWTVSGTQNYSGGTTIAAGATEIGTGSVLTGSFANAGTLQFDQSASSTFGGSISGAGAVVKSGTGTLTMGAQSYTGGTVVTGGTLALTGALAGGSYGIGSGATLTSALSSTLTSTAATLTIVNDGTIRNTNASGRAINIAGGANARTIALTNNAGATITSADDAFRINFNPTGGSVRVDNYGTIQTTAGGQALDFDAIAGTAATVTINNYVTGVLRSFGQDGIRPGQGAVVTNAGLIYSDGAANNNYDGIDWQARSGSVVNAAGGTISGLRHGITSDTAVNVTNAGTIVGRNGSGIGSDGTGTVVNTGTITGQWDGVAINGDGDGVDIDFIGTVTNSGTIQGLSATGVDSGGRPNSAEGIAMGGGTIINNAGALIFGAGNAVLINHDINPGGVADGATTINNAGTIRATTGKAIALVGNFADSITNSGTITGGTGGAIDMGDGNDTLTLLPGSVITGTVDGGAGTDQIILGGTGSGSFAGAINVESLAVSGGTWSLTAAGSYSDGITIVAPATLSGTATTLTGRIADAGTLIIDQASDASFAATLSGAGQFIKSGAGALTVRDQTGFTGTTTVGAGSLILAGTLPSAIGVASGARLAGNGTVAALSLANGATVAPGQSIGAIIVTGNFAQAAGSTYAVETTAAGLSDRITVGGTASIANGALLSVTGDGSTYRIGTRYTVLTAAGGITGSYTLAQTAMGDTEFRLAQSANAVFVDVARSIGSLARLSATPNQRALAAGLAGLPATQRAAAALVLNPDDDAVRAGLTSLAGEVHASLRTTMLKDAQGAQEAVRMRLLSPISGEGVQLWLQANGRSGRDDGARGTAAVARHGWSGVGGVDLAMPDGARFGIAGGYTETRLAIDDRDSAATLKSTHALVYAGGMLGPIALRSSLGYAWVENDVRRTVRIGNFADRLTSRYDGNVIHGQVEAGISGAMFGGTVEPFAGVEYYRVRTDGFTEAGGDAALAGGVRTQAFALSTVGVRGVTPIVDGLSARSRIGWQHALNDPYPDATLRFASGTTPFTVIGAPLSRDAAAVAIDLAWTPIERLTITSGYAGMIGGRGDDSTFRIMAALAF